MSGDIIWVIFSSYSSLMSIPCALYMFLMYSLLPFIISIMDLSSASGMVRTRSEFSCTSFAFYSGGIDAKVSGVNMVLCGKVVG